jgi:hypothetical protein
MSTSRALARLIPTTFERDIVAELRVVAVRRRDSDFGADSAKRRGRLVVHVSANAPERAAVGNVTGTTINEQLLLRQP